MNCERISARERRRLPGHHTNNNRVLVEVRANVSATADRLHVEGDRSARVFTAFWVRGDTIVAGMHVNDWDAGDRIRRQVGGPATDL